MDPSIDTKTDKLMNGSSERLTKYMKVNLCPLGETSFVSEKQTGSQKRWGLSDQSFLFSSTDVLERSPNKVTSS